MRETKADKLDRYYKRMEAYGIPFQDANQLRRIELTLHSWAEHECNGTIQRDEIRNPDGTYTEGKPYRYYPDQFGCPTRKSRSPIADREKGAINRANAIIAKYPGLIAYFQGDPRGGILYVIRKSDIPVGQDVSCWYHHGICVGV